ncbi:MAG: hypothetical protein JXR97_02325, partial [Planctomycetes bacterium]|nr:hypothetical protein [Planctomycetota bacterium]
MSGTDSPQGTVHCHNCGASITADSLDMGDAVVCEKCGTSITVGANEQETIYVSPDSFENRLFGDDIYATNINRIQKGTIIGRCKIERELGRGNMGVVYLAEHTTLHVPVAVKVLA